MFWDDSYFGGFFGWFGGRDGEDSSQATVTFTGIPGQIQFLATTSGGETVTETIADGSGTETLVYTAESSDSSLYQLTSISHGSHTHAITPDSNSPTFAFSYTTLTGGQGVIESITRDGTVETRTYAPVTGGYVLSTDTEQVSDPSTTTASGSTRSYAFAADGQITVSEANFGESYSYTLPLDPTAAFTGLTTNTGSTANTITETYVSGDAVITKTFVGSQTAGYALSQTTSTYIPASGSSVLLDVEEFRRADFNLSTDTVTWVGRDGTTFSQSTTANANRAFVDLGNLGATGDFIGETITHGSHTSFEIFYSSTGVGGEYMEVAHGSGTAASQTLSGLVTQIAALNAIHTLAT